MKQRPADLKHILNKLVRSQIGFGKQIVANDHKLSLLTKAKIFFSHQIPWEEVQL